MTTEPAKLYEDRADIHFSRGETETAMKQYEHAAFSYSLTHDDESARRCVAKMAKCSGGKDED